MFLESRRKTVGALQSKGKNENFFFCLCPPGFSSSPFSMRVCCLLYHYLIILSSCGFLFLFPFFLSFFFKTLSSSYYCSFLLFLQDSVPLCSPGCPGVRDRPVDQAGLKLKDPPASASRVLGLKVCAIFKILCLQMFCLCAYMSPHHLCVWCWW